MIINILASTLLFGRRRIPYCKQISGTPFGIPLQSYNKYLKYEKFLLFLM